MQARLLKKSIVTVTVQAIVIASAACVSRGAKERGRLERGFDFFFLRVAIKRVGKPSTGLGESKPGGEKIHPQVLVLNQFRNTQAALSKKSEL